jgi:hypothetical protein
MVSTTSARPSGARPDVPAKMTSSILPPRSDFAPCSPITQARPSTTFDLPDPFGPTMQVIPGSKYNVVADAKDLNPRSVMLFRYKRSSQPVCKPRHTLPTRPVRPAHTWSSRGCSDHQRHTPRTLAGAPRRPPSGIRRERDVSTAVTRVGRRRVSDVLVRQTDA